MSRPLDPTFDQRLADWLEDDPSFAPHEVLGTVLAAFPSIEQRRALRVAWRNPLMNRYLLPLAAALIVVVGAAYLLSRPASTVGPANTDRPGTPSPLAATTSPTASALATLPPLNLSKTFTSSRYNYSIGIDPTWTVKEATATWVGPDNSAPAVDEILVTGTVTGLHGASQPLAPSQTYEQWLAAFHANTVAGVPANCNGGDPATWPAVTIGTETGAWEQLCDAAEALVLVNDRVYVFSWANSSFDGKHLTPDQFKDVLRTVTFAP